MDARNNINVLFVCTHNSVRSIMAEGILNHLGGGRFIGYSAGSHPSPAPNPFALETLRRRGAPIDRLRSKSWDDFARADAPRIDFVITVCDDAAGEMCPVWRNAPMTAHWGVVDPGRFEGSDEAKRREFERVAAILERRIERFTRLPIEKLEPPALQRALDDIGRS
jgi:arsenate reductase (thioredoxin)